MWQLHLFHFLPTLIQECFRHFIAALIEVPYLQQRLVQLIELPEFIHDFFSISAQE